jgi:hypothetical protein
MAYSEANKIEIINTICESICNGNSLRDSLRGLIAAVTFYEWIDADQNKAKQYARACEIRAEKEFEEILKIADAAADDIILDDEGNEITNHNVIQRDRLRVDARKWRLSKMQPKKYGDRLETDNTHSGEIKIIREVKK